jgi:hypothetical protein
MKKERPWKVIMSPSIIKRDLPKEVIVDAKSTYEAAYRAVKEHGGWAAGTVIESIRPMA